MSLLLLLRPRDTGVVVGTIAAKLTTTGDLERATTTGSLVGATSTGGLAGATSTGGFNQ